MTSSLDQLLNPGHSVSSSGICGDGGRRYKAAGLHFGYRKKLAFAINATASTSRRNASADMEHKAACLYIRRTVQPQEIIEYAGTVVVFGDVERGGTVLADGDVIVLGHLLGKCNAGRRGNPNAVVLALKMEPSEVMIAEKNAEFSGQTGPSSVAEIASIISSGIIAICPAAEYDRGTNQAIQPARLNSIKRPAQAALFTGAYISIAGTAFLLFPKTLFGLLFSLENVVSGWIQIAGVLAVVFGIYYIGTALGDIRGSNGAFAFYLSTVIGRIFLFGSFCWLVGCGAAPPPLLIIGAINLAGALYMLNALRCSG